MAEAALFGIAKSVLEQLASPALDEFKLLWGHKEEFEKLEDTVTTIRNVLQEADRKQATDPTVQGWLERLRVVLYEADDLFDAISARVLLDKGKKGTKIGQKVRHFVSKPSPSLVKNAHKVKELRQRFDAIAADIKKFHFLPIITELDPTYRIRREETHSFVLRNEVVGREQETEDIVRMLLPDSDSSQQLICGVSVIAVIGIGGLGKTTLAKLVYNDKRVQRGFDLCMWACINYFSDLKQVLKTLLKSIPLLKSAPISKLDYLDLDRLQFLFRNEIEGKRFLLVLDDLWDKDQQGWRELKQLLSSGRDGSKILTTTRSELVAQRLWATKPYFRLKGMSDESGWLLFKRIAFVDEEDWKNLKLEQIGRKVVRKCANVPLAIVTIANLLREKEKEMWLPLVNDELSKVFPNDYKKIMNTLELSYKELPYPVKRCFGYCSLFPKDFEFEKGYLVSLWIAQGFVEPLLNKSLEDIAEEYFFCLVERCAFQPTTGDEKRKSIVTYKMHDLMHDLAKEVARYECISVDNTTHGSWDKTIRHVSINGDFKPMVDSVCSFSHSKSVRTFLRPCGGFMETDALKKLMLSFKSLRVLDLSKIRLDIPTSIGDLIHLRLLDLSGNNELERLPGSICSLPHLHSLILRGCANLEELPEDLGDLLNLRYLVLQGCNSLMMPLATLTSLVTLHKLFVHIPSSEYLEGLDVTGSLQFVLPSTNWECVKRDAERSSLSRKSRFHSLSIICKIRLHTIDTEMNGIRQRDGLQDLENKLCRLAPFLEPVTAKTKANALKLPPNVVDLKIKHFGGEEIPQWVSRLHKLVILKLEGCERCDKLPPLSHLPTLKELCISGMASLLTIEKSKSYEPNSFFPSLETLSIKDMWNLTGWWLQAPTVLPTSPRLTRVTICNCRRLTRCMPLFPVVEYLSLERVREEIIWQITNGNSDLKIVELTEIQDLSSIVEAQIRHLSSLQLLSIRHCHSLKSVALNGLAYLTCLELLNIHSWGKMNWGGQEAELRRIYLPRVRDLQVPTMNRNLFEGLKDMASLETLSIENNFTEELQEEHEQEEEGLPWKHLEKLHNVQLVFGEGFSMRNNRRLLHGFQHLTSLTRLAIWECKELYLSLQVILCLPHLQNVCIRNVEEVIDVGSHGMITQPISGSIRELWIGGGSGEWLHDIPWKSLPLLEHLRLEEMRNLKSLPEGIQHLSALRELSISKTLGLVSLPHWMSSLSSLCSFYARYCCQELQKRCNRLTGEDWPKIQHIRTIKIQEEDIDMETWLEEHKMKYIVSGRQSSSLN